MNIHFMQVTLSSKVCVGKLRRIKWSSKGHGATCSDPIAQSSTGGSISRCNFPNDVIHITVTLSSFYQRESQQKTAPARAVLNEKEDCSHIKVTQSHRQGIFLSRLMMAER